MKLYSHANIVKLKVFYFYGIIFGSLLLIIHFYQAYSMMSTQYESLSLIGIENNTHTCNENRLTILNNKCRYSSTSTSNFAKSSSSYTVRIYPWLHKSIFQIRSQSLVYCSIPKIATKTLLSLMIYVYVRDTINNLTENGANRHINQSQIQPFINISKLINVLEENGISLTEKSEESIPILPLLETFLHILRFESVNKTSPLIFLNPWRLETKNAFPNMRFRRFSNLPRIFTSSFTRVIFVRHPFERLASAYKERIAILEKNRIQSEPVYDKIRRKICRNYLNLTSNQHSFQNSDPCEDMIPTFEHFVKYVIHDNKMVNGRLNMDMHWMPSTIRCQVCKLQYKFIGKYETINDDLKSLFKRLNISDWIIGKRRGASGHKTYDYQQLYSSLSDDLICELIRLYYDDFQLFNYRAEDYIKRRTLICS